MCRRSNAVPVVRLQHFIFHDVVKLFRRFW